jgi:hypothetical protein
VPCGAGEGEGGGREVGDDGLGFIVGEETSVDGFQCRAAARGCGWFWWLACFPLPRSPSKFFPLPGRYTLAQAFLVYS